MKNFSLHFPQGQVADSALGKGVHCIMREANGAITIGETVAGRLLAQLHLKADALWLYVTQGVRGIYVNGRPVKCMALLRAGDSIYVDGLEILVRQQAQWQSRKKIPLLGKNDPRVVLRGVSGRHYGRAIPIGELCVVGASREADIQIDEENIGEHHADLRMLEHGVLLRHTDSAAISMVNGFPVNEAVLNTGDQIIFGPQSRFVMEISCWQPGLWEENVSDVQVRAKQVHKISLKRWHWLLLAAALLAGLISSLLLFGPAT